MNQSFQALQSFTTAFNPAQALSLCDALAENPLLFIRGGNGLAGYGQALRLEASGPNRMADLAQQWNQVVAASEVINPLSQPGTGLVAFGSFAFADNSAAKSVLIVPEVIIGLRDGHWWHTRISLISDAAETKNSNAADSHAVEVPAVSEYRDDQQIEFKSGKQTKDGFKASVSAAVSSIKNGDLNKVVLARDLVADLPAGFDLRTALRRLDSQYPSCWVYAVDGTFGASPELLVRVAHGQVSARVLAGTAGRGTDKGIDQAIAAALATSAKNLSEHAFAVDSLVSTLSPFCTTVDADSEPFSLALPNLWHLASDVHGVLKANSSVLDLAAALHPTAAVAGTPRLEAQQLIAELEPFDRGRYAGPVGWIGSDGDGEWAIALRGGQVAENQLTAFAGCGIVGESEPEAELAETELKFQPIRGAFA